MSDAKLRFSPQVYIIPSFKRSTKNINILKWLLRVYVESFFPQFLSSLRPLWSWPVAFIFDKARSRFESHSTWVIVREIIELFVFFSGPPGYRVRFLAGVVSGLLFLRLTAQKRNSIGAATSRHYLFNRERYVPVNTLVPLSSCYSNFPWFLLFSRDVASCRKKEKERTKGKSHQRSKVPTLRRSTVKNRTNISFACAYISFTFYDYITNTLLAL